MKKKILLTLTTLFISLFAVGVINVSAATYGDLTYKTENGEVTITDCNESVKEVSIPATIEGYPVTSIGESAFYYCSSLTSVSIPESVTSIGDFAFSYCKSLTSVTIPNSVTSIGNHAFYGCESLTSVSIPESVTSIEDCVFYYCTSLTSVSIPDSVTSIGEYAFYYCRSLKTVYYTGTEEQWDNISIDSDNDYLLNAEIIYNYKSSSASAEITSATSSPTSLKFISTVTIEGEPEIATFGTTFIPLWLFEEGDTNVATVQYNNSEYNVQNGQSYGATLRNVPEAAKNMMIVGKSFVKGADGKYTWSAAKSASVNNPTLNEVN